MTAGSAVRPTSPPTVPQSPGDLVRIPLEQLVESPWNPRKHFDPAKLAETAESLHTNGQLTPITVRLMPNRRGELHPANYEIGAGHRRFRAARMAGLTSLLAVVLPLSDVAFLELLTIENKQRDDVTPLDEAAGFRLLMEKAGYDVSKLAARIGLSTKYVYDRLKLLQLVPAAKKLLEAGTITPGHAIILARLSPTDQKRAIGDLEDVTESGEYAAHRVSLLLRPDHAAGGELPLHDQVKPVTVREFQQAVQEQIRATPERVDPFLFPESAAALEAAKEEKLSVIHITRSYRVSDEARDEKIKTYGQGAWERADGGIEEEWGTGKPVRSKTCAFSRYGFIAAGPGQGEVFRVCVNKEKCAVHWPEQFKKAQARKKAATAAAKRAASSKGSDAPTPSDRERAQASIDRQAAEEEAREDEHERWRKAMPALLKALADRIQRWGQPGATSEIGKYLLRHTDAVAGRSRMLDKVMKPGRTSEDFVRYIAFVNAGAQIENMYDEDDVIAELKMFGLDAQKIVDQAVPKPKAKSEKKQPAKPPARKGGRK